VNTSPSGYSLRPARAEDADGVLAVLRAVEIADDGVAESVALDVAKAWGRPRFTLERDAWVVEDAAGRVVAYCDAWEAEPGLTFDVECDVPPGVPRALEAELLRVAEARAREREDLTAGALLHTVRAAADNEAAELLLGLGWHLERSFLRYTRDLTQEVPPPAWPDGLAPHTFVAGRDEPVAHAVVMEAFQGHFHYPRVDLDEFRALSLAPPFAPPLSFVVREGDRPAAALIARDEPDTGWIQEVAVLPGYRRRGLATAMLTHAFALIRAHGHTTASLGVDADNANNASALYERAGMHRTRQYDFYALPLT
jgi:mycothiol synthase